MTGIFGVLCLIWAIVGAIRLLARGTKKENGE